MASMAITTVSENTKSSTNTADDCLATGFSFFFCKYPTKGNDNNFNKKLS